MLTFLNAHEPQSLHISIAESYTRDNRVRFFWVREIPFRAMCKTVYMFVLVVDVVVVVAVDVVVAVAVPVVVVVQAF